MLLDSLSELERNVLLGSILGDGTLTKIGGKTRRINSNYREHFGQKQLDYRKWKVETLQTYLYFNKTRTSISSKSQLLFTELENLIYQDDRIKRIPSSLLTYCTTPHFLAVLYLDDGSLSISNRVNHHLQKVYLQPHIYLYLQSFQENELELLRDHLKLQFNVNLVLSKRKDGSGFVLKTTAIADTIHFLKIIQQVTSEIPSMAYKSEWNYRFQQETIKWNDIYPTYEVLTSNRNRSKSYSLDEVEILLGMKNSGYTDQQIADRIGRSYWSVVYKLSDLRRNNGYS